MSPQRTWLTGVVAAVAVLATPSSAAAGAGEVPAEPGIDIVHLEQQPDGRLAVMVQVTAPPDAAEVTPIVRIDGQVADAAVLAVDDGAVTRTTVLALDSSRSMAGAPADEARRAAEAFLVQAPSDVLVGLITFSDEVQVAAEPSADRRTLADALGRIELTGGTHAYDAVASAVEAAGDDGSRSVLVLSDGRDRGSDLDVAAVADTATDLGVRIDAIVLGDDPVAQARLDDLAQATGGAVIRADDPGALSAAFTDAAEALAHQQLFTLDLPPGTGEQADVEVSVDIDGTTHRDTATVGVTSADTAAAAVNLAAPLVSAPVFYAAVAALALALAVVIAITLGSFRRRSAAQRRVARYLGETPVHPATDLRGSATSVAESVTRIVGEDFETRSAQRLAAAGMSLRPAEWLLTQAGIAVLAALAGWLLAGVAGLLVLLLIGALAPVLYLRHRRSRRIRAFADLLPETLTVIAGGLAAGLSVAQAIDTVVREGREPMTGELKRALVEHRLGVDLEDTLDDIAARMENEDFAWVVMAIRIQRDVGGNLAEVLSTVAETLRERAFVARQVRTLSAEGRLSAWILCALPVCLMLYFLVANRTFVEPLYSELLGWLMLGAAALLLSAGIWMMSRMVKVEV